MSIQLTTKVNFEKPSFRISHQSKVLMIGSCFSDNIGKILHDNKFDTLLNPFGVLYNPASINEAIKRCLTLTPIIEEELIYHNNLWHSFDFHGSFSQANKDDLLSNANKTIENTHAFLKSTNYIFVTFGTSWTYHHTDNHKIVANCHKLPASVFTRERLRVEDITSQWNNTLNKLYAFNPDVRIIFTVSPVKHLKDGAHGNQLSKATLLLAIDEIVKRHPDKLYYFPSYEIVNDELRDYRFYAEDMAHISDTAKIYIYDIFKQTFFNSTTLQLAEAIDKITKATSHRVLHNNKSEIKKFTETILKKIEKLEITHPFINLHTEKEYINQLKNKH
ncbi:MAG: GSCFA domain-containing protein [Prolixibacteraceae bacterium]|jgi:hypothetical protein|nr:GSCFA domain-containing protein [Prolixibacteraceae bacterium]